MNLKPYIFKGLFLLLNLQLLNAQNSIKIDSAKFEKTETKKINYPALIAPAALMTYGIVSLNSNSLQKFDANIRDQIVAKNYKETSIDDITTLAPAAAVYILNFAGIEGKHNFKDRSIVIATSFALTGASTFALKNTTKRTRPDGSAANSFPSGHSAYVFASAEFLWQEYKDVSIWYGISGYVLASGTGFLRMYNNRHWFSDVAMGAGIGILSTKVAYLLLPIINNKIFPSKNENTSYIVTPFYQEKKLGLSFIMQL
ncbi:phosphatase PAP2 family protein [Frigoriflavimonas asaccharolytica]|uniref:Membrane-associated phospholipid phosphatase n=1 Tax=Frigoriflavimonas asaccharolytica TaxID=2735899 RepID=A0A8J8G9U5_9FLAO|nr:phosphatase PAP2 family protein [Frigoriflavimonas asaccharolytica]NRS92204.1 membrane-associated phospholipid phosphatase [Frigoriflavimonas asaccharolytica]